MSGDPPLAYLREAPRLSWTPDTRPLSPDHPDPYLHRYFPAAAEGYRSVAGMVAIGGLQVAYGEVTGSLVNAAASSGAHLAVGILMRGEAEVHLNGGCLPMAPGDGVLFLPGDEAVQLFRGTGTFTLRAHLDIPAQLRIKACPFHVLAALPRRLAAADARDLVRLLQFFAVEYDRRPGGPTTDDPQIRVLADALSQRVAALIVGRFDTPAHAALVEICRLCDRHLSDAPDRVPSAREMARAACCSVRQLYRAFDQVVGASPLPYRNRLRLLRTRQAILAESVGGRSVADVAARFGWRSPTRFREAYRAEFGETPSQTVERRIRLLERLVVRG